LRPQVTLKRVPARRFPPRAGAHARRLAVQRAVLVDASDLRGEYPQQLLVLVAEAAFPLLVSEANQPYTFVSEVIGAARKERSRG